MIRRASVAYSGLYIGAFGKYKRPLRSHRQKWQKGGVCPNEFRAVLILQKFIYLYDMSCISSHIYETSNLYT